MRIDELISILRGILLRSGNVNISIGEKSLDSLYKCIGEKDLKSISIVIREVTTIKDKN